MVVVLFLLFFRFSEEIKRFTALLFFYFLFFSLV